MFHFTTRDLLWLLAVLGLTIGWWLEHRNANSILIAAANRIAGDWASEVGHPVKYNVGLHGGGTFNGVMGP